ncbi:MAG: ATP-binding protein [Candidatus Brockarchaeota archaeon]|nr:ATP-binding protein [Candidatus Brockarchaeota archaeon]
MANIEAIKSAIVDKEEELRNKVKTERIIERELKVEKISKDVASIITGVRRCGKSILAFLLTQRKNAAYVNFEDERLQLKQEELNAILEAIASLKGEVEFIVLDEIQYVNGWERFISRILPTKKVIITGSNARLMSKEFSTFLTGRHIDFELFPFSFREYLLFNDFNPNMYLTKDVAKTKNLLVEYLKTGGFPLTYKVGRYFLSENYRDIVERDVIQRYNIRVKNALKDLAKYYVSNCAKEISFNKLKNILNLKSVHTVKDYSLYLSNAYLIFLLEKYSPKLKESIIAPKKVYCIDNGIVNTIGFKISENFGSLMENLVAIELLRRKSYWFKEWEVYYWKDSQQNELDFVIKEGPRVNLLIQVTYASGKDEVERREIRSLIKASEQLSCKDLRIITWDYEGELKFENRTVKFLPLWKWLIAAS